MYVFARCCPLSYHVGRRPTYFNVSKSVFVKNEKVEGRCTLLTCCSPGHTSSTYVLRQPVRETSLRPPTTHASHVYRDSRRACTPAGARGVYCRNGRFVAILVKEGPLLYLDIDVPIGHATAGSSLQGKRGHMQKHPYTSTIPFFVRLGYIGCRRRRIGA